MTTTTRKETHMPYEVFDPLAEVSPSETVVDYDSELRQQGWEESFGVGSSGSPMRLRTYRRTADGVSDYMVELADAGEGSPFIRFDNFGDLLDALARWAPVIQANAVALLIDDLSDADLSSFGAVGRIAAKVVNGIDVVLPQLQQAQREAEFRRHERQAARLAKQASEAQPPNEAP